MADQDTRSIFDIEPNEALEAELDARAEADYREGRVVGHAEVIAWLDSWGSADELPGPTSKTP